AGPLAARHRPPAARVRLRARAALRRPRRAHLPPRCVPAPRQAAHRGPRVYDGRRAGGGRAGRFRLSMHTMLVLAGWPDHEPPEGGWRGADLTGRALLLAHLAGAVGPSPAVGVSEDQGVRAVLAGKLYNRRELTVALGGRHELSGQDDAEIVAHLYEERGVKCVKAMRGAFALALWDARRGRLLLARDHLGLMPLYFAVDGHRLAASSALPSLVALPGLAKAWDAAALDALLTFGF